MQNTTILFPTKQESRAIISSKDEFIKRLSDIDRAVRMKTNVLPTEELFLDFLSANVLEWKEEEKENINTIIQGISTKMEKLTAAFPEQISFIKTTGKEESNAGYCRENNIFLPISILKSDMKELENFIIHELFHILSKNNPELKEKLYKIIGFYKGEEYKYPKELSNYKLTNPDAYLNKYYIDIQIEENILQLLPLVLLDINIDEVKPEKDFVNYLNFQLVITKINDTNINELLFLDKEDINYYLERIGHNTEYIIHPDEILADNFVLFVNNNKKIESLWVTEKMKVILTSKEAIK